MKKTTETGANRTRTGISFDRGHGVAVQIQRRVDAVARVVVLEVDGMLGDRELLQLADELERTPGVEADFSLLIDLRRAVGTEVTSAGVRALAARSLVLSAASRRAVVVPSDLGYGMARMYEMIREDRGGATRAFRDYDEARRWVEANVR